MQPLEPKPQPPWESLQERIGYRFADQPLLLQALTHRSHAREGNDPAGPDNERLEFVGDAVFAIAVASLLYLGFPRASEGLLTQMRADLVQTQRLAKVARELGLGQCLQLGRSIVKSGGGDSDNLLADALEALIGAVYIDGGFAAAVGVIEKLLAEPLAEAARHPGLADYKTNLQELLQKKFQVRPEYRVLAVGPVHQCHYKAEVLWHGELQGRGEGSSKKRAEQAAAREALARLREGC